MAKKRTAMDRIREIIRLHLNQKLSYREISEQQKVGKSTIGEIISEFRKSGISYSDFEKMSDHVYLEILEKEKKKKCEKYDNLTELFEYVDEELKRPGVTLTILHKEYKELEPEGYEYSRFCYHYKTWLKKEVSSMHIEHKAGDKMFVDYAGKKLKIYSREDESSQDVETFVSILPASQLTYVETSLSQKKAYFIGSNENALHYFGGVPRAIVPDCLKSAVTKADKYEPVINETFEDFSRHYGTAILPARARKPKDKALVEGAVKLVYQRIYAPLRERKFYSIEELNEAIWELLEAHNSSFFQGRTVSRRSQFEDIEKAELGELPVNRYEIKEIENRTVQINYHVFLKGDDCYYSVPYTYKGEKVKVIYDSRTVEIYHGNQRITIHVKDGVKRRYVTKNEHMPSNHRFIADQSEEKLLNWAKNIGPATVLLSRNMMMAKQHPEQAFKAITGVLSMSKTYGTAAVEKACKKAILLNITSYQFIKNYLQNNQHNAEDNRENEQQELPFNPETRGESYYGGIK